MSNMRISRSDIEQLAQKLDKLGGQFTANEWTLLTAVLDAVIAGMDRPGATAAEPGGSAPLAGATAAERPSAIASYDPGTDPEPDPDKIGRAMYDHVISSFTAGEEDDTTSGSGPDKIGRA